MDEKPGKPARPATNRPAAIFILLAIAAILYVASIGPVGAITNQGVVSRSVFNCTYAPIVAICEWPPVDRVVTAYINMWVSLFSRWI